MPDKIRVTAIQRLCVNDGPGVRTVVFLKGCYLECPWCCNPEAIHFDEDSYFDKGSCKYPSENVICRNCELHGGGSLKEHCPINSFEKTYKDYDIDELYELLLRDEDLYRNGGGVTFSGGEPLMQAMSIRPLLKKLKDDDIHIALETTLYAPNENYEAIKAFVDYWIVDLKFQYGYLHNKDYDNIEKDVFQNNLLDLQNGNRDVLYRMVLMTEAMNQLDTIIDSLKNHHIEEIELLACHSLAEKKYKELGKTFHRFATPSKMDMDRACAIMNDCGINVQYVSI